MRKTYRVIWKSAAALGGTAIRLAPHVSQFTATDFSTEMIRIAAAKPAPDNLHFKTSNAETALDGGPFDAICAFNVLHLVDDLPGLLGGVHAQLRPGGLLIGRRRGVLPIWGANCDCCFSVLRVIGLFPPSATLGVAHLRQAIQDAGFEIVDQRIFGVRPQNPYIVACKPTSLAKP